MKTQFIKLPEQFSRQLLRLPETGMGYQLVKVVLNSGRILDHLKVFNASLLEWSEKEPINTHDIIRLELESK
jgi:hypothetical protein